MLKAGDVVLLKDEWGGVGTVQYQIQAVLVPVRGGTLLAQLNGGLVVLLEDVVLARPC